jgi:tungstate transport system substrate-binding protein
MRRSVTALVFVLACALQASAQERTLVIAATTSIQDSGFADYLARAYRERKQTKLTVVSRPTAQALATAHGGFVDVVIGNHPAALGRFMDSGDGARRTKMMFDDFVIVGPVEDPAGARGKDAAAALRAIARHRAIFVSCGDNSGTHALEHVLWDAAKINPKARTGNWYRETGLGVGLTLEIAARLNGYVLIDRGTWVAHAGERGREVLVEGDPRLFNQYELIVVSPHRYQTIDPAAGSEFANWIVSDEGRELITKFMIGGRQVFFPNGKEKTDSIGPIVR